MENNEFLHISEDRVGLKYYHDIEMQIYNILLEKSSNCCFNNAGLGSSVRSFLIIVYVTPNGFNIKIEQAIRHAEEEQGFQYVVEQLDTINKSLHRTIPLLSPKSVK